MVVVPDTVETEIEIGPQRLKGLLGVPAGAEGLVIFAHGSGSGRFSPRNNRVAAALCEVGLATLLLDLLTPGKSATAPTCSTYRCSPRACCCH